MTDMVVRPKVIRNAETTGPQPQALLPYTGKDFSSGSMTQAMAYYQSHQLPDWHQDANCKGLPQEWFFGDEEEEGVRRRWPTLNISEVKRARDICAACPVMQDCLEWALANKEEFGIWGGTTGRDRRKWWHDNGFNSTHPE